MQHALPVTFGLKLAGTLDALLRWQVRLREMRSRVLALQFGGAAGTLDSLKPMRRRSPSRWQKPRPAASGHALA
jgi:3-carboxy-cis,cis-muconate cycloisomerase